MMASGSWTRAAPAWAPVLAYMAIIFALSAMPDLPVGPLFAGFDKLEHAVIYAGLALLAFRGAVLLPLAGRPGPYIQSLLLVALYGASDEYHQKFVPGRTADAADLLADILGGAAALALAFILRKCFPNRRR